MSKFFTETVKISDLNKNEKNEKSNNKNAILDKIKQDYKKNIYRMEGVIIEPDSPFKRKHYIEDYNPFLLEYQDDKQERVALFKQWKDEKNEDPDAKAYTLEECNFDYFKREEEQKMEKRLSKIAHIETVQLNNTEGDKKMIDLTRDDNSKEIEKIEKKNNSYKNKKSTNMSKFIDLTEDDGSKVTQNNNYVPQENTKKIERDSESYFDITLNKVKEDIPLAKNNCVTNKLPNPTKIENNHEVKEEIKQLVNTEKTNKEEVKKNKPVTKKPKIKIRGIKLDELDVKSDNTTLTNNAPVLQKNNNINRETTLINNDTSSTIISKSNNMINTDKYIDKDESLLLFNKRLLTQANDDNIPLLERVNFLAIADSNIDEFSRVRLAKKRRTLNQKSITGESNATVFKRIKKDINTLLETEETIYKKLNNELLSNGLKLISDIDELSIKEKKWVDNYYDECVGGMLVPLVFDNARPFPRLKNNVKMIGLIIRNEVRNENLFGAVEVPEQLDRFIEIKSEDNIRKFILLEDVILSNLHKLYINRKILKWAYFRILREYDYRINADDFIEDAITDNINSLYKKDNIIRLDITSNSGKNILHVLDDILEPEITIKREKIVDYKVLLNFYNINLSKEMESKLKFTKLKPVKSKELSSSNIFEQIDRDDVVLQHPYDSYDSVVKFIRDASQDKYVTGIKQTLYRVSDDSPIIKALLDALKNGKQVTVVSEIKARFDEMNNIKWAKKIEDAGGRIIYGASRLKVHAKMCIVTRLTDKGKLKQYAHVATGNYNEKTSKIYTDISYFTSNKKLLNDLNIVFNSISGSSEVTLNKLIASPNGIRDKIISLIDNEIKCKKEGKSASITMKMNGLTEKGVIDKLYEAADNGVDVTLVVRGACSLYDTSKIKVKSVIGQFLEHSRIYRFKNDTTYISSADLMDRNLFRRIEIMIPINDDECNDKINAILDSYANDKSAYELIDKKYERTNNIGDTDIKEVKIKTKKMNTDIILYQNKGDIYGSQEYFKKCANQYILKRDIYMNKLYSKTLNSKKKIKEKLDINELKH